LLRDLGFSSNPDAEESPQERGFFCPQIGDAGLFLTEGQLEALLKEGFDLLFEVCGQGLAAGHALDPVIGISQVFTPDEVGVIGLHRRERPHLFDDLFEGFRSGFSTLQHASLFAGESVVGGVAALSLTLFQRSSPLLQEFVELMEIDVRQQGAD
jgi:hypothetical protein